MERSSLNRKSRRSGYTLIEVLVATATGSMVVAGLAASLQIASLSLDVGVSRDGVSNSLAENRLAQQALARLQSDLQTATDFSEMETTAVTMTVPDRNEDGSPETIRYVLESEGPDEDRVEILRRYYNAEAAETLAEDVSGFQLEWRSR